MEIWKEIASNIIENIYSVSNLGRVRNDKNNHIYISKSNKHKNYIKLYLKCKDGKKRQFLLHRLVAETFIDNPNNYPIINHIDENKQNNCVNNLEWCTQKYNMQMWFSNKSRKEE